MEARLFIGVLVVLVGGILVLTRRPESSPQRRQARRTSRRRAREGGRALVAVLSADRKLVDELAVGLARFGADVVQRVDVDHVASLADLPPDAFVVDAHGLSRAAGELLAALARHHALADAVRVVVGEAAGADATVARHDGADAIIAALAAAVPLEPKRR